MRHGEKGSKKIDLSNEGFLRAQQLPQIFRQSQSLPHPELIIAMNQNSSHSSNRPYETVKFLADDLGISINLDFTRDQVHKVVEFIEKHTGKNILVVWEHIVLCEIIKKITGIDIKWHEDDYDSIYIWSGQDLRKKSIINHLEL